MQMIGYRRVLSLSLVFAMTSLVNLASGAPSQEALKKLGATITETQGVITQIQVNVDSFTEADYRTLAECTSLKSLSLNGKTLNDQTLPLLAPLTELDDLSTNQSQLTDAGYRHITQFKNLRRLKFFHPSWDMKGFTGSGLAYLKALPKLESLTFAGATTNDEALAAIGELTQLREFRTWHTMQSPAGNKHLLNLTKLTFLRIGQRLLKSGEKLPASFDEATIPLLAQMKSLERLELTEARLSAKSLLALQQLPNLKQVSLSTVDISAADVEQLQKALPKVKIDFKPLTDEERELKLTKQLKI